MLISTTKELPAVAAMEITDWNAANAGIDVFEQDAMTLQSMPLRARRVIVRLDAATVIYHATNLRVRVRTQAQDGLLAYVTFGPRATGSVEGLRVRSGMLVVAEPDKAARFIVNPGYESIAVLVRPDDIRKFLTLHQRGDEFCLPRGVEVLQADPPQARRLFRCGKRLAITAARRPARFDYGRPERDAAEVELLETLLAAVRLTDTIEPVGAERTQRTHDRIVGLAEDLVLARHDARMRVADLCIAADVSERTLESSFKATTGLSPVAYLTRLRLHRVHAALLAAEPGSTRVSVEAIKWGFWHLGDFSRAYKQCFGESPSQTLRRGPAGIPPSKVVLP